MSIDDKIELTEQIHGYFRNEAHILATCELYQQALDNCIDGDKRAVELQLIYLADNKRTKVKPGLTRGEMMQIISYALNEYKKL